jgi:hypothetical protein
VNIGPGNADDFDGAVQRLSSRLGDTRFKDAAERGRMLRDEELVRYALGAIAAASSDTPEPTGD